MPSGRWEGSDRASRLPAGWASSVRPAVFALYGDACHVCGLPGSDTVDHVVAGDNDAIENLRPIHEDPCHRRKTAQEGVAARAARRAAAHMPIEQHPGLS